MANHKKKAVCLLSGGLDSTTTLYVAKEKGFVVYGLVFDYGQRHRKEIRLAKATAASACRDCQVIKIVLPWQGSSLLDKKMALPDRHVIDENEIPSTYVPGRNIIFLSFAASYAEVIGAGTIFIGANAVDYSGYPDCRPDFLEQYQKMLRLGLKDGRIKIAAPLIRKTKAQIIRLGLKLGVPYEKTWSCYKGAGQPCGVCDSCRLRAKGFAEAGVDDPAEKIKP